MELSERTKDRKIRTGFWYVNVKEINAWEYLGADVEVNIRIHFEIMIGRHRLDKFGSL